MSAAATPLLLRSDEEELTRAARALSEGSSFYPVVCSPALRPAVKAYLAAHGVTLTEPAVLSTGEEALSALVAPAPEGNVRALAVGEGVAKVFETLNWHREKLRRGSAFLLWLDDLETLGRFHEMAPDAYAFRDGVVLVRGDGGPLPELMKEDPPAVVEARKKLRRAKTPLQKAYAARTLADKLRFSGSYAEAETLVSQHLSHVAGDAEGMLAARLALCSVGATIARERRFIADAHRRVRHALDEVGALSMSEGVRREAALLNQLPGPVHGRDTPSVRSALSIARRFGLPPEILSECLRTSALTEAFAGRIAVARALAREAVALGRYLIHLNAALGVYVAGAVACLDGSFAEGTATLREAVNKLSPEATTLDPVLLNIALAFGLQGELDVASRWSAEIKEPEYLDAIRSSLLVWRGDVPAAIDIFLAGMKTAVMEGRDGSHEHYVSDLVTVLETAAGLPPDLLTTAVSDVESAEDASLAITGPDRPPWYAPLFRRLRARAVALVPDRLDEAIALARESLTLAGDLYPDLAPRCARTLAELLLKADRFEEARSTAEEHQPLARERALLRDLANLLAVELAARARLREPPSMLDTRLDALRAVLTESDSPRVKAETLLHFLTHVPPDVPSPDLLSLADEAHTLFAAMPMPANEARCLEIAGDVLLARGQPADAKSRYRLAHNRLERLGLSLRLPFLTAKLDRASVAAP